MTDEQHLPHEVAFDEHGVVGAFDLGERMVERDQRRMHAGLDPPRMALRVGDQLDRVPELAGVPEVDGLDAFDTFAENVVRADLDLIRDRPEDREFVRGVESPDVVGRIRLGEPGRLSLAHRVIE